MSEAKLRREAKRWLSQARDDLDASRYLLEAGKHAQAAFFAQQAAEKAMKAVWIARDLDPWGHSVARLIRDLPEPERARFEDLLEAGYALDKLYIPTRYPDALADLTPAESYTRSEAEAALAQAEALVHRAAEYLN